MLARDRFGIKPLYYRADGGGLEFASELRALPRGEVDLDALEAFLAFNSVPAPLSIFRGDAQAAGRAPARLGGGGAAARALRAPGAGRRRRRGDDEAELAEELGRGCATPCAPTSSRTCRSACCSPAASTRRCSPRSRRRSRPEPVRTFTIGFGERSFDELAGARAVAERYGTDHRELVLEPDAALLLPALAEAFDEPFADSSALPTYLVSELAARDVKVALSGEGGDELFGGY